LKNKADRPTIVLQFDSKRHYVFLTNVIYSQELDYDVMSIYFTEIYETLLLIDQNLLFNIPYFKDKLFHFFTLMSISH